MSQDYEVIGATYDGRKIVEVTIQGATINANSTATFTASAPSHPPVGLPLYTLHPFTASVPSLIVKSLLQLIVKRALNYMTPSSGTFSVTTVDNTVSFTLYAGTTTSISTIDVILEAV
ncbi:MAG: hypothetical protein RXO24_10375 [Acidilobus sp.]|jgi:hypothetical protein